MGLSGKTNFFLILLASSLNDKKLVNDTLQGEQLNIGSGKTAKYYFKDGLKHGEEIQYSEKGGITLRTIHFEGKIANNDTIKFFYPSGNILETVNTVDGLRQGKWTSYYDSPEKLIELERTYVNDTLQGPEIGYYESGNIENEATIIDGIYQGKQTFYFDSEKLIEIERIYENDTLTGNKSVIISPEILNMKPNILRDWTGKQIFYFDSPEKLIRGERDYVDGIYHGMEIGYYESGNLEYEVEYIDGLGQVKKTFYFDSPDKLIMGKVLRKRHFEGRKYLIMNLVILNMN